MSACAESGLTGVGLNILQINATSVNKDTFVWLVSASTGLPFQVFLIQEHKLLGHKYYLCVGKLKRHFHVYAKGARIKISGASGGVMVLTSTITTNGMLIMLSHGMRQ